MFISIYIKTLNPIITTINHLHGRTNTWNGRKRCINATGSINNELNNPGSCIYTSFRHRLYGWNDNSWWTDQLTIYIHLKKIRIIEYHHQIYNRLFQYRFWNIYNDKNRIFRRINILKMKF